MFCAIYRSQLKDQTYLYIEKKEDFSRVPDLLLQQFGIPKFAMVINLAERTRLASVDIETVRRALVETGYYLQIPPPVENLLVSHLNAESKSD